MTATAEPALLLVERLLAADAGVAYMADAVQDLLSLLICFAVAVALVR